MLALIPAIPIVSRQSVDRSLFNELFPASSTSNRRSILRKSICTDKPQTKKLPLGLALRQSTNTETDRLPTSASPVKRRLNIEKFLQTKSSKKRTDTLNLSGSFEEQTNNLLHEDGNGAHRMPRIRRKSDTSFWSGGLSSFEKKIGFFTYEIPVPKAKEGPLKTENTSKSPNKKRNTLRKAVLLSHLFKINNRKDSKDQNALDSPKGSKSKRHSMMTSRSDSIIEPATTKRSRGSFTKDRSDSSFDSIIGIENINTSGIKISNFSEATKKEGIEQNSALGCQNPNLTNGKVTAANMESKIVKKSLLGSNTKSAERKFQPKASKDKLRTSKNVRLTKKSSKRIMYSIEEPRSLNNMTPSRSCSNLLTDKEKNASITDSELLSIKDDSLVPGISSMEKVDLHEKKALPVIKEGQTVDGLKKKRIQIIKNLKIRDTPPTSIKSLNNLPAITTPLVKTIDYTKRQMSSLLDEKKSEQVRKMKVMQEMCEQVDSMKSSKRAFTPVITDLKRMISTYMKK